MTKKQLLSRLERIRDGVLDSDTRHMLEGMCEDISNLMWDIQSEGIDNDPR